MSIQVQDRALQIRAAALALSLHDTPGFKFHHQRAMDGATEADKESLKPELRELQAAADKALAEERMHQYADFLLHTQEPQMALALLRNRPPICRESLFLDGIERRVRRRLEHVLGAPERYVEFYDRPLIQSPLSGARNGPLLDAAAKPETKSLLSVGPNNAAIERVLLDANPGLHITVAELGGGFAELAASIRSLYGERFHPYAMSVEEGLYTWAPTGAKFDVVSCFEVIEHVPDAEEAVYSLAGYTADTGVCLISTPDIRYGGLSSVHDNERLEHVRSFIPSTFAELCERAFGFVTVLELQDGSLLAVCRHRK